MAPAEPLAVTYCEGWDPTSHAIVGVLPVAVAYERDRVGEQYAVLLGDLRRPYALIEVAWRHGYVGVWFFDQALRRTAKHEFRRLSEDRLFLLETVQRCYQREGQAEFDPLAWKRTCRYDPDGNFLEQLEPAGEGGGLTGSRGSAPVQMLWEPVPRFGGWASLARRDRAQPAVLTLTQHPDPDASARGLTPGLPAEQRPWRPPRPLAPADLDALFRAGTRFALPLAVTVSPGEYPVTLAVARWEPPREPGPSPGRVAAARLLVRDEPVAAWELALRPDEDPRLLGEEEFYGFGVDTGKACLVDAAAADHLHDNYVRVGLDQGMEVAGPGSGANGFLFASGWGDGCYPVWIGRTAAGEVACFVADMLVLVDATVLP